MFDFLNLMSISVDMKPKIFEKIENNVDFFFKFKIFRSIVNLLVSVFGTLCPACTDNGRPGLFG